MIGATSTLHRVHLAAVLPQRAVWVSPPRARSRQTLATLAVPLLLMPMTPTRWP